MGVRGTVFAIVPLDAMAMKLLPYERIVHGHIIDS